MAKNSLGDSLTTKLKQVTESSVKTVKTPEASTPKGDNIPATVGEYYRKPDMYLDSKDFPGIKSFAGKKDVYIAVKAKVSSYSNDERIDDKGKKTERTSVTLEIMEIADLTDLKAVK